MFKASPELINAIIHQESRGNPRARSPVGAMGLMQVMPDTAKSPGFGIKPLADPWNQEENKRFGTDYINAMLSRYKGDLPRALAAYNWGPGNADKWSGDMSRLPAETRDYINKITGNSGKAPAQPATAPATPQQAQPNVEPAAMQQNSNSPLLVGIPGKDAAGRKRKLAEAMAAESMSGAPVQHWLQGAGRLAQALAARKMNADADEMEQARQSALVQALSGVSDPNELARQGIVSGAPELVQYAGMMTDQQAAASKAAADARRQELDAEYKRAQIGNLQSQINERNNPLTKAERGLQPQFGVDANGNPVILQLGKDGTAVQTQLPEGVQLSKEPIKLDAGTHFVLLDPITRQPVGQVAKDLAGEAAQKEVGKDQGAAAASLPQVDTAFRQAIRNLDELATSPGMASGVGTIQGRLPDSVAGMMNSDTADFRARLAQVQGRAFLQAFESLKGGGQITEIEGQKAEQAIARLNAAVNERDFVQAINDAKRDFAEIYNSVRQRAGSPLQAGELNGLLGGPSKNQPSAPAQQGGQPSIDDLVRQYGG